MTNSITEQNKNIERLLLNREDVLMAVYDKGFKDACMVGVGICVGLLASSYIIASVYEWHEKRKQK